MRRDCCCRSTPPPAACLHEEDIMQHACVPMATDRPRCVDPEKTHRAGEEVSEWLCDQGRRVSLLHYYLEAGMADAGGELLALCTKNGRDHCFQKSVSEYQHEIQEASGSMDVASSSRKSDISVKAAAVACTPPPQAIQYGGVLQQYGVLQQFGMLQQYGVLQQFGVLRQYGSPQSVASLDELFRLCSESMGRHGRAPPTVPSPLSVFCTVPSDSDSVRVRVTGTGPTKGMPVLSVAW
eukprot:365271-Chlamydomonas_euryale.AAC.11